MSLSPHRKDARNLARLPPEGRLCYVPYVLKQEEMLVGSTSESAGGKDHGGGDSVKQIDWAASPDFEEYCSFGCVTSI
jgi:hypothetical protein